jgi:DNA-binding GntR family transcriptional regulator
LALPNLKPIKEGRLPAQAAQTLRHAILAGDLPLGTPLREAHLARQLKVSQTTIRESLVQLGQLGLVVRRSHRGTVVTKLSNEEVRDRLVIRLLLEGLAWEEAARRMTADDFTELEARLKRIGELAGDEDYAALAEVELDFHHFIWEKSANPTLLTLLEQLTPPLFVYVTHQRRVQGDTATRRRYKRHQEVVEALRSGQRERLHDTLKQHLTASYGQLIGTTPYRSSLTRKATPSREVRGRARR